MRLSVYPLIVSIIGLSTSLAFAQMKPVFNHTLELDIHRPLELAGLGLMAPSLPQSALSSLDAKLDSWQALADASNPSPIELEAAYLNAASYLQSILIHEGNTKKAEALRSLIEKLSAKTSVFAKDNTRRNTAQLYYAISLSAAGKPSKDWIMLEKAFVGQTAVTDVARLHMALQLYKTAKDQALAYLEKVEAKNLFASLSSRLINCMLIANIDQQGRILGPPNDTKELEQLSKIALGLPTPLKESLISSILFIWKHAYPSENLPFGLEEYSDILPVAMLIEQRAITATEKSNYPLALGIYESIKTSNNDFTIALTVRLWQLHLDYFRIDQDLLRIESKFEKYYSSFEKSSDKKARRFARILKNQYSRFARERLSELQSIEDIKKAEFLERYLKFETKNRNRFAIKKGLASYYEKIENFDKALTLYVSLSREFPKSGYEDAIRVQSRIANWPVEVSWIPKSGELLDPSKLELLSRLYRAQLKLNQYSDWRHLAQLGLLLEAQSRQDLANELWLSNLPKSNTNPYKAEIVSRLIESAYKVKNYNQIIWVVRHSRKQKIKPTKLGASFDQESFMAEALFEQAELASKSQKHKQAIGLAREFIASYPNDKRHFEARARLGGYLYFSGDKLAALKNQKSLIEQAPDIPNRKQILLESGNWGTQSKDLYEFAFFFYSLFIKEFVTDPYVLELRPTLAQMYVDTKLYGWAASLFEAHYKDKRVGKNDALIAAIRHMNLEQEFGSKLEAEKAANRVMELSDPGSKEQSMAYAFFVAYAISKKDKPKLIELETKLTPLIGQHQVARSAMGNLRFYLASTDTRPITNTESNLFIKDPEGSIRKLFDSFEKEKVHYLRVCQIGLTNYCAPALMQLAKLSQTAITAISKIKIAETLGEQRINAFEVFKQIHVNKLLEIQENYANDALKLANAGTTTQMWQAEITKTLDR